MKWTSILPSFVHLFNRYALVIFYVPGAVIIARVMNKIFKEYFAFIWLIFHWGLERQKLNKEMNTEEIEEHTNGLFIH